MDVKLGVRMLGKQPLLTLVAALTLAVGIPAALIPLHAIGLYSLDLPVDEGDRVLGLRNWNQERGRQQIRLHDYEAWRESLRSFQSLAAVRSDPWNVHSPDGRAAEVRGAEVTASIFPLLRVPPLMGRALLDADQAEGAPRVAVISEDLWESRFARDSNIIGTVITIGRTPHTVVGVMPSGFYFPRRDFFWVPLLARANDYALGEGPDVLVVGRLADGATKEQAEAELGTVGDRLAAAWPETYGRLTPEVVSFPTMALGALTTAALQWEFLLVQLLAFALLAIVCGNIGTLTLARTATRLNELTVRTALGASRARILGQLFVESLVLSVGATVLGLIVTQKIAVSVATQLLVEDWQYWFDLGLSARSVLMALGVATGCAVIAGLLPAIKATSPRIQQNLQQRTRGATVSFGRLTTALVVAEVALSVGFLCFGTAALLYFSRNRSGDSEVPIDRFAVASLRTPWVAPSGDLDPAAFEEQFQMRVAENHERLRDRLAAHPSVRRVAMARHVPGIGFTDRAMVLEGSGGTDEAPTAWVNIGQVHFDYFRDMGMTLLQGRGFSAADVEGEPGGHRPAIVANQAFVDRVLGGGEAVGRRLRFVGLDGVERWHEIVGVVETFGTNLSNPGRSDAIYQPLGSADFHPMRYIVEVAGSPSEFLGVLRQVAADIDPEAMVQEAESLEALVARSLREMRTFSILIFVLAAAGMLLAATGLYSLMSFTVAQRTREIGIRTALGAGAGRVVITIARRAVLQLLAGVALGSAFGWWIVTEIVRSDGQFQVTSVSGLVGAVAGAVILLSTLSCLPPMLRGLRIEPTEALSEV